MRQIAVGLADDLDVSVAGAIATITLVRPDEHNRITADALERLGRIADALRQAEDIHVVVVRGAGSEHFSAGILNPVLRGSMSKDEVLALVFRAAAVFDAIEALPQVVIAGINGSIRVGAVELALACDIRISAAHARLSMPEARWGGFPGAGGPVRLPGIVGYGRAMELICTARDIDADEMLRIGLVERVASSDEFDAALGALAGTIAESGPLAVRGSKQIMQLRRQPGFQAARALSDALRRELEWSADVDEALAAHRDGRAPKFVGR